MDQYAIISFAVNTTSGILIIIVIASIIPIAIPIASVIQLVIRFTINLKELPSFAISIHITTSIFS